MKYATLADVEGAVYKVVKELLGDEISGSVYLEGMRPNDSKKEDAIVVVSAGTARQIQEFSVYVNVFVPDIQVGSRMLKDRKRCNELSEYDQDIIDEFNTENSGLYEAELYSATRQMAVTEIKQHFVSYNFKISCLTFNL